MALTLVHIFEVTIPAGTPKAAPLTFLTQFGQSVVTHFDVDFPPGCQGQVGIQIGARNVPVFPSTLGQFLVRSATSRDYDVVDMHETGDWSVIGYNTGTFPHTVRVTFLAHRRVKPPPPPGYLLGDLVGTLRGGS